MSFENRREYLFVYSVKDANPNGDPLDANHPRYDEESGQIMVSDVRIKRTVRDQWLREGKDIFVDGEAKTLANRVSELKERFSRDTGREILSQCIDTRLFGATYALGKEAFSWTGPVQFKWGRSLHRAEAKFVQGTAAFATKEASEQRSFRNEYIVPFALIAVYGIANQYASRQTNASDDDLDALFEALWKGTANLITRSKIGHTPRLLIEFKYVAGFDGALGSLDEKVVLKSLKGEPLSDEEQLALRSIDEVKLGISEVADKASLIKDKVESVRIIKDAAVRVEPLDKLEDIFGGNLKIEVR